MEENNNLDSSKRRFIKTTIKAAYIAPLVVSLPAQASWYRNGSNHYRERCETPKYRYYKSS